MSTIKDSPRFAFLLGAGASFEAGLPTLMELTSAFANHLKVTNPDLYLGFQDILGGIGFGNEKTLPDAEGLLGHLERIIELRHPLLLKQIRDAAVIQHELRKFIWDRLSYPDHFEYLNPLRNWQTLCKPMDVFSLNNDLVIEKWCGNMGLTFSDGFDHDGAWHIGSFESSNTDIRLYKIHGSINWFRDLNTDLLKSVKEAGRIALKMRVARTPVPDTALLFPAHTKDLLYPPLLQLFNVFYLTLCKTEILVVVGCQLKDEHIHRAIRHALLENAQLRVLIVDPAPGDEIVNRILTGAKDAKSRIATIRKGFGSFLQCNPNEIFESLFAIQSDKSAFLKNVLSKIQQTNAPELLIKAVEDCAKMLSFVDEEKTAVQQIIEATPERPKDVDSPLEKVFGVLQKSVVTHYLEKGLREAAELLKIYRAPSCYGVDCDKKSVWVVSGQPDGLIRYDPTNWMSANFAAKFFNPRGLAFYDNTFYIIECSFLKIEGLGALYAFDLVTSKGKRLFPASWWLLQDVTTRIKAIAKIIKNPTSRNITSRIRELAGFLNWPSSVRILKNGQAACVVEARKIRIVNLKNGKTINVSPPRFFNLVDAVEWEYPKMILLEAARVGGGNIAWYDLETDKREIIVEGITAASGLALSPDRTTLLFTESRPRPDGKLFLVQNFNHTKQVRKVLDGINKPRHIAVNEDGVIYLASRDGVLRLKKGLNELIEG